MLLTADCLNMARGWESKSIEQQQSESAEPARPAGSILSLPQQKLNRRRESLLLARKHLENELPSTSHPERRRMLERSIAEIDKQLSSF